MVGIDPNSDGLKRAREMGIKTTAEGVDGLLPHVLADGVQIAFDATSAYVHKSNSDKLNALGVLMVGNVILFWLARRSGAVGGGKKKRPLGAKKRQRQVMARGLAAPE